MKNILTVLLCLLYLSGFGDFAKAGCTWKFCDVNQPGLRGDTSQNITTFNCMWACGKWDRARTFLETNKYCMDLPEHEERAMGSTQLSGDCQTTKPLCPSGPFLTHEEPVVQANTKISNSTMADISLASLLIGIANGVGGLALRMMKETAVPRAEIEDAIRIAHEPFEVSSIEGVQPTAEDFEIAQRATEPSLIAMQNSQVLGPEIRYTMDLCGISISQSTWFILTRAEWGATIVSLTASLVTGLLTFRQSVQKAKMELQPPGTPAGMGQILIGCAEKETYFFLDNLSWSWTKNPWIREPVVVRRDKGFSIWFPDATARMECSNRYPVTAPYNPQYTIIYGSSLQVATDAAISCRYQAVQARGRFLIRTPIRTVVYGSCRDMLSFPSCTNSDYAKPVLSCAGTKGMKSVEVNNSNSIEDFLVAQGSEGIG